MFDVWCYGCGGEMLVDEQVFLFTADPSDFICDDCVTSNERTADYYDDWALASAGWGMDEDY